MPTRRTSPRAAAQPEASPESVLNGLPNGDAGGTKKTSDPLDAIPEPMVTLHNGEQVPANTPMLIQLHSGQYAHKFQACQLSSRSSKPGKYALYKEIEGTYDNDIFLKTEVQSLYADLSWEYAGQFAWKEDANLVKTHDNRYVLKNSTYWVKHDDKYYYKDHLDRYGLCWSSSQSRCLRISECSRVVAGIDERRRRILAYDYMLRSELPTTVMEVDGELFLNERQVSQMGYFRCPEHNNQWCNHDAIGVHPSDSVAGYHSAPSKNRAGSNAEFMIGFEIEKEDRNARKLISFQDVYALHGWRKERDGSLNNDTGFELVSPIFDLYDNNEEFKKALAVPAIAGMINGKYSKSCGGHINLSQRGLTPRELFDKISGFLPLLYAMYEFRLGINYCKAKKKKDYIDYQDKYAAVFIKSNVLEFRIFPAVKSVAQLIWRRDLMQIMVENMTGDPLKVIDMVNDSNSRLFKHLRKVYSEDQLIQKTQLMFQYMREYNDVTVGQEKITSSISSLTKTLKETNEQFPNPSASDVRDLLDIDPDAPMVREARPEPAVNPAPITMDELRSHAIGTRLVTRRR